MTVTDCGASNVAIPTYTPRYIGYLDTWRLPDWTLKLYGISAESPSHVLTIDKKLIESARSYVETCLEQMNTTPNYSVGFVILHHGSAANWLLTQWWTDECICRQHVARSELSMPHEFTPASPDLMACAYELVPIDFERRAWVSTAMSGKAMDDYLSAWLPDGYH